MDKVKHKKKSSNQSAASGENRLVECAFCEEEIERRQGVVCSTCKTVRHMKKKCAGFSKAAFEKDAKLAKGYICAACQSSEPDSESDEDDNDEETGSKGSAVWKQVLGKIGRLEKNLDKKMDQLQAVVEMYSAQIDEVASLKKQVSDLNERVRKIEKAPRHSESAHREVIITNVPPLENENTVSVVQAIFNGLEAAVKTEEVAHVARFESAEGNPKKHYIKVQLTSDLAKGRVIKAARAAKATLKDLKIKKQTGLKYKNEDTLREDFENAPIFVNEVVSRGTKILLQAAIALKKEKVIHTTWTYLDRVYIRKEKGTKPLLINSEEQLKALKLE